MSSQLGVSCEDAYDKLSSARGSFVKLRGIFGELSDADPEDSICHATRAYMLYILVSTLFADMTVTRVSVIYLQLLADLDQVDTYA